MAKYSEEQIAELVVWYLQDMRWDVYQEVTGPRGIADIVAIQNGIVWVVEVKKTLGLQVISQAHKWKWYANFVSVAVPAATNHTNTRVFAEKLLLDYGIGHLSISYYTSEVSERTTPKLHRKASVSSITEMLFEEQKTYSTAGNVNNRRYTAFSRFCDNVYRYVASSPGCTLKELFDRIPKHYGSNWTAKTCLIKHIQNGVINNIVVDRKEGVIKLYTKEFYPHYLKMRSKVMDELKVSNG